MYGSEAFPDGGHGDGTVVPLAQHHQGLLFGRLAIFPLVVRDKDPEEALPLSLERQGRLNVQVPAISVQRRHHRDARLPQDPLTLPVAPAV